LACEDGTTSAGRPVTPPPGSADRRRPAARDLSNAQVSLGAGVVRVAVEGVAELVVPHETADDVGRDAAETSRVA
jgi:hypothetical protein